MIVWISEVLWLFLRILFVIGELGPVRVVILRQVESNPLVPNPRWLSFFHKYAHHVVDIGGLEIQIVFHKLGAVRSTSPEYDIFNFLIKL